MINIKSTSGHSLGYRHAGYTRTVPKAAPQPAIAYTADAGLAPLARVPVTIRKRSTNQKGTYT